MRTRFTFYYPSHYTINLDIFLLRILRENLKLAKSLFRQKLLPPFHVVLYIQGYSKRIIHFEKFILQVVLNIWWCAVYRLKGEFSKLFSHLTSTRCEPHVWRGRCQIDNPALPTLVAACQGNSSHSLSDAPLQIIDIRTLRDFLSIRKQDMDLTSVVF
jgi:hypothetical protein